MARSRRAVRLGVWAAAVATVAATGLAPSAAEAVAPGQQRTAVQAQAGTLAYRGGVSAAVNATSVSVTVPAAVRAGDTLLLFAGLPNATATATGLSGVTGWTGPITFADNNLRVLNWTKTAAAGDAGRTLKLTLSAQAKVNVQLLAYSGSLATKRIDGIWTDYATTATAVLPAPPAQVPHDQSLLVHVWMQKSSETTGWTVSGATERLDRSGTGGGHVSSVSADRIVGSGLQSGVSATATAASKDALTFTVVLNP